MKKNLLIIMMIVLSMHGYAQENIVTISGGYSFAKIEDTDITGTGFRINGLYEFNSMNGSLAHGIAFGYIGLTAEDDGTLQATTTYKINSFPLYYQPKFMFGKENFKGFVKGVLGMQFAGLKKEGFVTFSDNDYGFYGGGGAGIMIGLGDKFFINAEYEIAWASNSWYKDGWMNTAMGGIGIRF